MSGKGKNLLAVFLLVLCVQVANAGLTGTNGKSVVFDYTGTLSSDAHSPFGLEIIQANEPSNSHFSAIAAEFREAPVSFAGSPTVPIDAKSLPTVPGALSMAAIGFLCVSLVKDRKIWLAALAALMWTGQAGTNALPQLVLHLSHGSHNKQQSCPELTYQFHPEDTNRLRSDIEGTKYIGLLHRLAGIPDTDSAFTDKHLARLTTYNPYQRNLYVEEFSYYGNNKPALQTTVTSKRYSLNSPLNCFSVHVKQFNCFSPAFIFEIIPRGPPNLA